MLEALLDIIASILIEFLFYTVCYSVGRVMLKLLTFGHYPPPLPRTHNEALVAVFPLAVLIVGLLVAYS